jgi:hypothetical protein
MPACSYRVASTHAQHVYEHCATSPACCIGESQAQCRPRGEGGGGAHSAWGAGRAARRPGLEARPCRTPTRSAQRPWTGRTARRRRPARAPKRRSAVRGGEGGDALASHRSLALAWRPMQAQCCERAWPSASASPEARPDKGSPQQAAPAGCSQSAQRFTSVLPDGGHPDSNPKTPKPHLHGDDSQPRILASRHRLHGRRGRPRRRVAVPARPPCGLIYQRYPGHTPLLVRLGRHVCLYQA